MATVNFQQQHANVDMMRMRMQQKNDEIEYFEEDIPKVVSHYRIQSFLGQGGFSKVYQAKDMKHNQMVAMKFVSRDIFVDQKNLMNFEKECRIFSQLNHPNIAKYYETIFLEDYIVIVMELLQSGNLLQMIANPCAMLTKDILLRWTKEVLEALKYLDDKGISHRDIKPENIVFDDNMRAKIVDFGLSSDSKVKSCSTACGTPFYIAPEVLLDQTYDGHKADIWSFGVTFHYLYTKQLPFPEMTQTQFYMHLENIGEYITNKCTNELKEIIDNALIVDPKQRLTAKQLLQLHIFKSCPMYPKDLSRSFIGKMGESITYKPATRPSTAFHRRKPQIVIPKRTRAINPMILTMLG